MVAAFRASIPVEVRQEAGVIHAIDALPSGDLFSRLIRHGGKRWAYSTPTVDIIPTRGFNLVKSLKVLWSFGKINFLNVS